MDSRKLFVEKYQELRKEHNVRIYSKDLKLSWVWALVHWILFIFSLGKNNTFMSRSVITVGRFIFFYSGWRIEYASLNDYSALCQEEDHVIMAKKFGLGSMFIGTIVMILLYLLFPLPIGLAWFRYAIERSAFRVSYLTDKKLGLNASYLPYVDILTGPGYLWAWPFKKQVLRWFEKNCGPLPEVLE